MTSPSTNDEKGPEPASSSPPPSSTYSLFGSLQRKMLEMSDSQRLARLEQCQSLHGLLQTCRDNAKLANNNESCIIDAQTIENVPAGIRMLRYFQWRNVPMSDETLSSCRREEHALWACRAVGTGCGASLVEMKMCFDKQGVGILDYNPAYESSPSGEHISPCSLSQQALAACVAREVKELNQRIESRKSG